MWNQTGEADWGSEMDRHSPTGPWLCCQRNVDYMTEGGMWGKGGGVGGVGWEEDVNGVWTGGFIPVKGLPPLLQYSCPRTKALFTLLSNMDASQQWARPAVVMRSTERFDCFY